MRTPGELARETQLFTGKGDERYGSQVGNVLWQCISTFVFFALTASLVPCLCLRDPCNIDGIVRVVKGVLYILYKGFNDTSLQRCLIHKQQNELHMGDPHTMLPNHTKIEKKGKKRDGLMQFMVCDRLNIQTTYHYIMYYIIYILCNTLYYVTYCIKQYCIYHYIYNVNDEKRDVLTLIWPDQANVFYNYV